MAACVAVILPGAICQCAIIAESDAAVCTDNPRAPMWPLTRPCSARTFVLVSATLIVLARAELSPLDQACFDGECRHPNAGFVLPSWSPDRL